MNEHDSAKMAAALAMDGWVSAADSRDADLILFNTCTVREKSHHKAVSEAGRALKMKRSRPHLIVGLTGCVAQEEGSRLFDLFPSLDLVVGPDQICRIAELVREASLRRERGSASGIIATEFISTSQAQVPMHSSAQTLERSNTRLHRPSAFVTIMKGCNNFCSFCIVPYVRGREASRPPEDIIGEIGALCERGVKEVTLLGQNVNSYGMHEKDFGTFAALLKRISAETDVSRIRYVSPHPKDLSDDLIAEHGSNEKLCEHIHLPLQSGSTRILGKMNRRYTKEDYLAKIDAVRSANPRVAVTTDIIVGFPGESGEDFKDTLDVMDSVRFDGMFAFKYSPRHGTAAAKLADDVPAAEKSARLAEVLRRNERIVLKKNQKYVGSACEILVEGGSEKGGGQLTGRTRTNKIVNFDGPPELTGSFADVAVTMAGVNSLRGELIGGKRC
jgi:tRNA-2-methylthio-N6-dimethylallyladenosine synthase